MEFSDYLRAVSGHTPREGALHAGTTQGFIGGIIE